MALGVTICGRFIRGEVGRVRLRKWLLFQAEDGIRGAQESRGLGDVYKRQPSRRSKKPEKRRTTPPVLT